MGDGEESGGGKGGVGRGRLGMVRRDIQHKVYIKYILRKQILDGQ